MGTVLLVRHGQTRVAERRQGLSGLGSEQSRLLGLTLKERGYRPDVVLHADLIGAEETAATIDETCGWQAPVIGDAGWNDYDHEDVLGLTPPPSDADRATFSRWFDTGLLRWTSGEYDADYAESFGSFRSRVRDSLQALAYELGPRGRALVVTGAGPVAFAVSSDPRHWRRLHDVVVSSSITKIATGPQGTRLVSFNEHGHLERRTPPAA